MDNRRSAKARGTPKDDFELSPSARRRYHRLQTAPFPRCRPLSPTVARNSNFGAEEFSQRRRQHPQHDQRRQQWPQNNKQSRSYPSIPQNHYIFFRKSQRLKETLIRILIQALWQIEQWCPDDISDGDLMDWQPEDEIVIPQPDGTVYAYGEGGAQNGVVRRCWTRNQRGRVWGNFVGKARSGEGYSRFRHFGLFCTKGLGGVVY
ncbi:hypothetical protein NA56DRAFT_704786 [Hyaloscypha hepaticicola]|uniref:Uncharacterized protein n=1 Tax=Hyaloscypha hepaticicola TaxID=2082293 RepID=A0A2J6Q2L8_9HELO|nr:hypothetical protein NA56DRAFT_704786 [Hyaloscypha hepaticicola]